MTSVFRRDYRGAVGENACDLKCEGKLPMGAVRQKGSQGAREQGLHGMFHGGSTREGPILTKRSIPWH